MPSAGFSRVRRGVHDSGTGPAPCAEPAAAIVLRRNLQIFPMLHERCRAKLGISPPVRGCTRQESHPCYTEEGRCDSVRLSESPCAPPAAFNAQLMDYVRPFVQAGISTQEIDRLVHEYTHPARTPAGPARLPGVSQELLHQRQRRDLPRHPRRAMCSSRETSSMWISRPSSTAGTATSRRRS